MFKFQRAFRMAGLVGRMFTKGATRLAANTVKRGAVGAVKKGGGMVVRNPLKAGALGVLGYSSVTGTSFVGNLWGAITSPLDLITGHGFSAAIESIEEPFMAGILTGAALRLGGFDNHLICIAAPAGVELLLHPHEFSENQIDPFHIVWNVVPASAGGYLGCMALGMVMS